MTDFRPDRDPDAHHDADALADLLERLQASGWTDQASDDDPRVEAARRLADAPHPVMRAEANARIEAQLMAAAQHMPGSRQQRGVRRVSWPLAAAAALVLALAAVLVPQITEQTAAPATVTPTMTPSATVTLTVTPSATPTLTLTPTPALTETALPTETPTVEPLAVGDATPDQAQQDQTAVYDCANPPPDNAQALGWREHCEGAESPSEVVPGQEDTPPGRSGDTPGNSGNAPGQQKK